MNLGTVLPPANRISTACTIKFGADDASTELHVYQQDGVGSVFPGIADYDPVTANWASAAGMFGACLESRSPDVTESWNLDSNGSCAASDLDPWTPIAHADLEATATVAAAAMGVEDATVSLRFGAHVVDSTPAAAYSAPLTIEVIATEVNSPPDVPALVTPSNGTVVANGTPQLRATHGDDDGDTGTIDFQVCTAAFTSGQTCAAAGGTLLASGSSASGIADGADGTWNVSPALTAGQVAYWRARATDEHGSMSSWSSARSFTVNSPPSVPDLVSPAAAATVSPTPQLTATFDDPSPTDTGTIDFQVCTVAFSSGQTCAGAGGTLAASGSSPSGIADGANGAWTVSPALNPAVQYYWRARATDVHGASSAWSASRAFTTSPPYPFVASTSAGASSTGGTINLALPAGVVEGDLLVASISYEDGTANGVNAPAGWTQLGRADNGTSFGLVVFYKFAGPSESGPYSFDDNINDEILGRIAAVRGVNTTTPVDAWSTNNGNSSTVTGTSISTTVANATLMFIVGADDPTSITPPGGMNEEWDSTGAGKGIWGATEVRGSTGATGNRSVTIPSDNWGAIMVAWRPF